MSSKASVSVVIKALDQATAPIRKITRELQNLSKAAATQRLTGSFTALQGSIRNVSNETSLLAQRYAMLSAAGVGLFASFVKPASELENLKFRLDDLYGSAEKGDKVFKWLRDFATKSPYSVNALTESLAMFKNQGLDSLKDFENIVNYMGVKVPDQFKATNAMIQMSQAWGKGKLQMQDMRPMIEAGVPIFPLLSKVLGKTTAEIMDMSAAGQLNKDVMKKLFDYMGKEALTSGSKIGNLFTTKLSNLGDAWSNFAYDVMNTDLGGISVFQELKNDIQKFTDMLKNGFSGESGGRAAEVLAEIYHTGKELAVALYEIGVEVWPLVKGFVSWVGGIKNAIKWVAALAAIPWVASLIGAVAALWGTISAIIAWVSSSQVMWAALGFGIALWEGFLAILATVGAFFAAVSSLSVGAIIAIVAAIVSLIYIGQQIMSNWDPTKSFLDNFWNGFLIGVQNAINFVGNLIGKMTGLKIPQANFSGARLGGAQAPKLGAPASASIGGQKLSVAPKTDNLHIKMDIKGAPATITAVKSSGDSNMNFRAMLGQNVYAT